jgi:Domain of unknown function (DUF4294)
MMNRIVAILLFVFGALHASAQWPKPDSIIAEYSICTSEFNSIWRITTRDTFAVATLAPLSVQAYCPNRAKKRQSDRLQAKVVKVYPYAKAAGDIMRECEVMCMNTKNPKDQKRLLDEAEEKLKAQFEKDLRAMTISEGVLLIKLIDRETGNSSYALVKELKGKMSAFMWQGVARVFGHNLKDEYDPQGEDAEVENIVLQIEDGSIPYTPRQAVHLASN